jgi:hypothetical protein
MSVQLNWALCSHKAGDGHQVNPKVPERPATREYLTEVVQVAVDAGFVNILVPSSWKGWKHDEGFGNAWRP